MTDETLTGSARGTILKLPRRPGQFLRSETRRVPALPVTFTPASSHHLRELEIQNVPISCSVGAWFLDPDQEE